MNKIIIASVVIVALFVIGVAGWFVWGIINLGEDNAQTKTIANSMATFADPLPEGDKYAGGFSDTEYKSATIETADFNVRFFGSKAKSKGITTEKPVGKLVDSGTLPVADTNLIYKKFEVDGVGGTFETIEGYVEKPSMTEKLEVEVIGSGKVDAAQLQDFLACIKKI